MASPKGRRRRRAKAKAIAAEAVKVAKEAAKPVVTEKASSEVPAPKVEKTSVKQTVVSKAKKLKSKLSTKSDS